MSDIGLRIGAAGNQAATILQGSWRAIADGTVTAKQIGEIYGDLVAEFVEAMNTLQAAGELSSAFPGTVQATPAEAAPFQQQAPAQQAPAFQPANVVPGPFGQQAPAAQPQGGQNFQAAVPGQSHKDDAKWQELFNNPSGFYDNRQDKASGRNPDGPDFKNKQSGRGLWLRGKYGDAPQWVFDRLQGGYGPVQ